MSGKSQARVEIRGGGAAAACCGHLLRQAGGAVRITATDRPRIPAILISQATQALLSGVYQQPQMFDGLPRINRRTVQWGRSASMVTLPHSAVVISEGELLKRIHPAEGATEETGEAGWTIYASRPLPPGTGELTFGTRMAAALPVARTNSADEVAIESLEDGWLFMIPESAARAWLIAVGAPPDVLLSQSRLIADRVGDAVGAAAVFPAYPRVLDGLCGPGWLACGSAALGFDPIAGDGTGAAIREAILASAVVRAAAAGGDVDSLLEHYRTRILAGFYRHLTLCREFYRNGHDAPWWHGELSALERGIEWCLGRLPAAPSFRYSLVGYDLMPVEPDEQRREQAD